MKKKLLLLSLLSISFLFAEEPVETKQQFGYVSTGLIGPLMPMLGGGYRIQSGFHGADLSLQAAYLGLVATVKANLLYLHYFQPNISSEFYVGGGIASGIEVAGLFNPKEHTYISPEFVIGKQYLNQSFDPRFFQMEVGFPTPYFGDSEGIFYYPVITLSYGFGF